MTKKPAAKKAGGHSNASPRSRLGVCTSRMTSATRLSATGRASASTLKRWPFCNTPTHTQIPQLRSSLGNRVVCVEPLLQTHSLNPLANFPLNPKCLEPEASTLKRIAYGPFREAKKDPCGSLKRPSTPSRLLRETP